jgi:F-type H+-transporting ATPase subunit gamma
MQTLESLERSIRSAEDLYAIVRTMKTIAAVNIRHYEKAVESVAEYFRAVELGLQAVLRGRSAAFMRRAAGTPPGGLGAVVFGSDQGLAGGFNDQIVSLAMDQMERREPEAGRRAVLCVGGRAAALLGGRGQPSEEVISVPPTLGGVTSAVEQLVLAISAWQEKRLVGRVMLFHNRPVSSAAYEPRQTLLLPLDPEWLKEIRARKWPTISSPLATMDLDELFSALIQQYIFVSLYRAFAESMASENAARLAAMQAAQKNIEERIENLNSLYRSQRQSSITSELLDIVSGFEALRSKGE